MTEINPNMTQGEWIEAARKELASNIMAMEAGSAKIIELQDEIRRLKSEYLTLWDEFCVKRDHNVDLQNAVDRLQRWKDAVPVEAIRIRTSEEYWDDHGPWDEIDAWLNTLDGAKPEVQP